ncbi:leucine-rich repeat domain-containing protein [Ktedonosporobacter rubrisoli]|uniref:Leucine-rich repeat domain-containing protein n=1 Tax=Ktedonosporobacter rubrisoli TaxID=2509675 RepID=A0A4P6K011_KTERU|nr:leucine-rich repeat domain-containing protein [Ktedonosporobacter rubrisoli]QBD81255.1 leucine-rich repeat domain-containing protein [Ktedonosporobacter rubrisoli]
MDIHLDACKIDELIVHIHDPVWQARTLTMAEHATPQESAALLYELIARGDPDPERRPVLHLLALACWQLMPDVSKTLSKTVQQRARMLIPPRNMAQVKALATAGALAIKPIEQYLLQKQGSISSSACAYCIRALALVGNEAAFLALEAYVQAIPQPFLTYDTHNRPLAELLLARANFEQAEYGRRVLAPLLRTTQRLVLDRDYSLVELPALDALQHVTLQGTCKPETLQPLTAAPGLGGLTVSSSFELKHLKGIECLHHLQEVYLDSCPHLTDVSALSLLPNLKKLSITRVKLTALKGLQEITQIEQLMLHRSSETLNLDRIARMSNIRELCVYDYYVLNDLRALSALAKLRALTLDKCLDLAQLDGLQDLAQLETLNIYHNGKLSDISALRTLSSLRTLRLRHCSQVQHLNDLRELHRLEALDVHYCSALTDISALASLTSLRSLDLSFCPQLEHLRELHKLGRLERLNLRNCRALKDIGALAGLPVSELDLRDCKNLQDISILKTLQHLKTLHLPASIAREDVEELAAMPHIKQLYQQSATTFTAPS